MPGYYRTMIFDWSVLARKKTRKRTLGDVSTFKEALESFTACYREVSPARSRREVGWESEGLRGFGGGNTRFGVLIS